MNFVYEVKRTRDGQLEAVTKEALGQDGRVLLITTRKYLVSGIVCCDAMVVQYHEDGNGYSWVPSEDFGRRVAGVKARASEKTIRAVHERAAEVFEQLLADARAHYATKEAA